MKCSNCGVEWTIPPTFTSKIDVCPFCGKSIHPAKKQQNSMDDVLPYILKNFGSEAMKDGAKLQSLFADLAPELKREKTMLRYFVQCDGQCRLFDALRAPSDEARAIIHAVISQMEDDLLMATVPAKQICKSFWIAIGGDHKLIGDICSIEDKSPLNRENCQRISSNDKSTSVPLSIEERLHRLVDDKKKPSDSDKELLFACGKRMLATPKQVDEGLKLIRYAAQHGHHGAVIQLGDYHSLGIHLKKDDNVAEAYYRQAAVSGNREAQYKLGVSLHRRKSYQAREWLQKSADAGYGPAIDYLRSHIIY